MRGGGESRDMGAGGGQVRARARVYVRGLALPSPLPPKTTHSPHCSQCRAQGKAHAEGRVPTPAHCRRAHVHGRLCPPPSPFPPAHAHARARTRTVRTVQ